MAVAPGFANCYTVGQDVAQNIVLCFDGTNNEFGPNNSNVVRLVQALAHSIRFPSRCRTKSRTAPAHSAVNP